jgi:hypothetical protein
MTRPLVQGTAKSCFSCVTETPRTSSGASPSPTGRCTAVAGSPRRRCTPDGFGVRYPIIEREPHKRRDLDAVELTAVASHDDLVGLNRAGMDATFKASEAILKATSSLVEELS